jgi:hypothetical protein
MNAIKKEESEVVFCCFACEKEIIRNSEEHDNCVCDDDGENWTCADCVEEKEKERKYQECCDCKSKGEDDECDCNCHYEEEEEEQEWISEITDQSFIETLLIMIPKPDDTKCCICNLIFDEETHRQIYHDLSYCDKCWEENM